MSREQDAVLGVVLLMLAIVLALAFVAAHVQGRFGPRSSTYRDSEPGIFWLGQSFTLFVVLSCACGGIALISGTFFH